MWLFYLLLLYMIKYKLKWVEIVYSEKFKRDVLIVPLVWRWIDGKFDKHISPVEALDIVNGWIIDPNEKNSVMSINEKANYWKKPLF